MCVLPAGSSVFLRRGDREVSVPGAAHWGRFQAEEAPRAAPGGFRRRTRSALLGWRSLVWMLTSLLTSESNEEDAGDSSRISRDHLNATRLPTLPGPPPPPPITDSNLMVTRPFFGSAWLGVSASLLSKLRVCFGWLLPCSAGCQAGSSVAQHGRQASVGRLGGPSCESGLAWTHTRTSGESCGPPGVLLGSAGQAPASGLLCA